MSIPDAAVSFLLENIAQAVKYNYGLIAVVKENLEALQGDLDSLRDLMKDFAKYNHDSDYVRGTVKRIRKIVGRAEDAVDTYLLHAAVQKSRGWLSKKFHNITDYPRALREVGKEIEEIGKEVREINQNSASKGIEILQYQATRSLDRLAIAKPKEAPIVEEDHVIGFENATEAVAKLVAGGAEQFETISIIGKLGLGKTTLAKKVFKDPKSREYRIRAFVHQILSSIDRDDTDYDVDKVTAEMQNVPNKCCLGNHI